MPCNALITAAAVTELSALTVLRSVCQLPAAQRQQPADPVCGRPPGQRDQGAGGGGVGPLQIIDDNKQRCAVRGFLEVVFVPVDGIPPGRSCWPGTRTRLPGTSRT